MMNLCAVLDGHLQDWGRDGLEQAKQGLHLVLHEGEQRRHDHRHAPRHHCRQLVAQALACTTPT